MELRKQGKIDEKVFAETRLRRGIYGQRYDNGQRHDGKRIQKLNLPADVIKGPDTLWDAPGMMRIKIPFGGLTPEQFEVLADLSEEYADGVSHVTTRQDFQFHFVHIDDTPPDAPPRRGRNHDARSLRQRRAQCDGLPAAGICRDETFDVDALRQGAANFLLGHPDTQDFGRKFKIAFSGCQQHPCGLVTHARHGRHRRDAESSTAKKSAASHFYVGGGLGAVPYKAKLFDEFLARRRALADGAGHRAGLCASG